MDLNRQPDWRDGLPYRRNVGICLINEIGDVWMGKAQTDGPEIVSKNREWQMPQGGLEPGEDPLDAARRELWEETGAQTVSHLGHTGDYWPYDFLKDYTPTGHRLDAYRGQVQTWVAFRFEGPDEEFNLSAEHTQAPAEFLDWQWMTPENALKSVVSMKLEQYKRVFNAFSSFLK